ncbi:MAG: SDR family NAD(P)-dependent oxidoreductase [Nodosilinea sp.]
MTSPVVLITDCSSGIGKVLCQAFHRRGYQVVATARRLEAIDDLKAHTVMTLPLDVTDSVDIRQVIEAVLAQEGRIDLLVNNAGFGQFGPLIDLSAAPAPGPVSHQCGGFPGTGAAGGPGDETAAIGRHRQHRQHFEGGDDALCGRLLCLEAALHSLSEALRMELAPFGIQVVTVQPGAIHSNFGQAAEQGLVGVLSPDSWYAPLESKIRARAVL